MALHRYGDFRVEVFYFDSPCTPTTVSADNAVILTNKQNIFCSFRPTVVLPAFHETSSCCYGSSYHCPVIDALQEILTQLRTIFDLIINFHTIQDNMYRAAKDELAARQNYDASKMTSEERVSVLSTLGPPSTLKVLKSA